MDEGTIQERWVETKSSCRSGRENEKLPLDVPLQWEVGRARMD